MTSVQAVHSDLDLDCHKMNLHYLVLNDLDFGYHKLYWQYWMSSHCSGAADWSQVERQSEHAAVDLAATAGIGNENLEMTLTWLADPMAGGTGTAGS